MAAFPVNGGVPWEVPLGVGGPPAMDFIFWRAGQDTQDTQDTHDGGNVGLRAEPLSHWVCSKCEVQAGAVLGVLGVLGVLAKALEREAA